MTSWSAEQIARLKTLCRLYTVKRIAVELGRPYEQVRHQIRKQGFKTQVPWKRDSMDSKRMVEYSLKHGIKAAAEKYGVSLHVVKNNRKAHKKRLARFSKAYSEKELLKLRDICFAHAHSVGKHDLAEDFSSWVMVRVLSNPYKRFHSVRHLWGNYWGSQFGASDVKKQATLHSQQIVEDLYEDGGNTPKGIILAAPDTQGVPEVIRIANELDLKPIHRAVLILVAHYGFSFAQLSTILGYSEAIVATEFSRVCRQLKSLGITREEIGDVA